MNNAMIKLMEVLDAMFVGFTNMLYPLAPIILLGSVGIILYTLFI